MLKISVRNTSYHSKKIPSLVHVIDYNAQKLHSHVRSIENSTQNGGLKLVFIGGIAQHEVMSYFNCFIFIDEKMV